MLICPPFIEIKDSSHQEILSLYATNNRASRYIWQKIYIYMAKIIGSTGLIDKFITYERG